MWQWPMRGKKIGEASHPGPLEEVTPAQEEYLFGSGLDPDATPMRIEIETSGSEVDAYIHSGEERTSAAELDDLLADVSAIVASLEGDEVISPIPLTCFVSIGPNIPDAPTEDGFGDMMSRAGESEEGDNEVLCLFQSIFSSFVRLLHPSGGYGHFKLHQ